MFSISIAQNSIQWRLSFKDEAGAAKAFAELNTSIQAHTVVQVTDSFGQTFVGIPAALLFEDMDLSKLANIEFMLFNASIQVSAQKRAQTDPQFRAASTGPSVISPMGNGGRF